MAGGVYSLDPTTGQPLIQTAGGAMLPVPLSEEELQANGLRLADIPKPDMGTDMRVAGPGGAPDLGNADPAMAQFISEQQDRGQIDAIRQQLAPRGPAEHSPQPDRVQQLSQIGQPRPAARGVGVDPSTLARPNRGAAAPQAQPEEDNGEAAIRDQLMREALQGGGGGGPRRLGVAGETHKYTTTERPIDPEMARQAQQAQLASQGYDEQLAKSLQQRQLHAYEMQQEEFAARSGQLAAAQQRYEQQQAMLQDYAAKRDAAIEEARQMKAPQMEEYWGSRGTLTNVMTGLSIALGGALQGLRGGQNPGLEMSNQSIERWLQQQREDYQRASAHADRLDNQYARMVQQFGSENQALEHMRLQAWEVRDGMLKSYAEKVGTPDALEAYNQAMLQSEAQKAEALARASQGAQVEIEQKLSMQGGGGDGRKTLRQALSQTAGGIEDYRKILGRGQANPQREVQTEKVDGITGALEAIEAADEVSNALDRIGGESDVDDPLSGAWDSTLGNIPGTETRAVKQRLQQQTRLLARGIQKSLGKSDNDAKLADEMAEGGGSINQRRMAAQTAKQRATGSLQTIVSSLTPDQQQSLIQSLRANSPERAAQVEAAIGAVANPGIAASERPAF